VMDGESKGYRSVADLALALESSSKLNNIEITGLSLSTDGENSQVNFSISANLVDWGSSSSVEESGAE